MKLPLLPWKFLLSSFCVWRLFLLIIPILAAQIIPFRPDFAYTSPTFYTKNSFVHADTVLTPWANFDGVHYLAVAANGYHTEGRFFPFYPLILKIGTASASSLSTLQIVLSFIISQGIFFLALLFLYVLVRKDFSEAQAKSTVLACLLFPTSFFFVSIYSEGTFLLLSLASFYFARQKKWWLAALFGMLLSATRLVGIFILPALLFEFYIQNKEHHVPVKKMLPLFIIPIGILLFSFYNYLSWGDALYFLHAQGDVQNGRTVESIVNPVRTVFRYGRILTRVSPHIYEWWVSLLELVSFFGGVVLFLICRNKKIRMSYLFFGGLCFLLPVLSGNFTGLPRYLLAIFPYFFLFGIIKQRRLKIGMSVLSILLTILLVAAFSRGYFIA